jgi:hypothetical protein
MLVNEGQNVAGLNDLYRVNQEKGSMFVIRESIAYE